MPIKAACQCGARFNAKDELAGKRVKCPKCGQPLVIPSAQSPAPQAPAQPQPQQQVPQQQVPQQPMPQQPPAQPQMPAMSGGLGNLLDEAGIGGDLPAANVPKCPNCSAEITPGSVICVECGFNSQTGATIKTHVDPDSIDKTAHLSDAEQLIAKAEQAMKETPMNISNYGDGWESWVIAAGLGVGAIFLTQLVLIYMEIFSEFMAREPEYRSQFIAKYFFIGGNGLGLLIMLLTWVRLTGAAFTDHKGHGLACLTTFGLYSQFYACWHWSKYYIDYIVFMTAWSMVEFANWMYYDTLDYAWEVHPPHIRITAFLLYLVATKAVIATTFILIARSWQQERKMTHGIVSVSTLGYYAHIYALLKWADEKRIYIAWAITVGLVWFALFIEWQRFPVDFVDQPFSVMGLILPTLAMIGALMMYSCWIRVAAVAFENENTKSHGILTLAIPGTFYTPVFAGMHMKKMMPWFVNWIVGFLLFLVPMIMIFSMGVFTLDVDEETMGKALALEARQELRQARAVRDGTVELKGVEYNVSRTQAARNSARQYDQTRGIQRDASAYEQVWSFDITFIDPENEEARNEITVPVPTFEGWSMFGGRKLYVHPMFYD